MRGWRFKTLVVGNHCTNDEPHISSWSYKQNQLKSGQTNSQMDMVRVDTYLQLLVRHDASHIVEKYYLHNEYEHTDNYRLLLEISYHT